MGIPAPTPLPIGTGLDLNAIWLNIADDLADVMAFEYDGDSLGLGVSTQAEVRQLATRRRVVRSSNIVYESLSVTFYRCSAEQRLWLRNNVGVLMCVRDHVGTKFYAVYTDAPLEVSTFPRDETFYTDVKLTFEQIDHSESA